MGCLKRLLLCSFLGLTSLVFLLGSLAGLILDRMNQDSRLAREAPRKSLFEAMNSDGPAWVRVFIEPASESVPLRCGDDQAVWVSFRGRELVTQEIRRGGVWRMRSVWKERIGEAQTIPVVLKSDSAQFRLNDWVGVEPWPDLLRRRKLTQFVSAEHPDGEPDEREWDVVASVSTAVASSAEAGLRVKAGTVLKREGEDAYVPAGIEVWTLGKWHQSSPQVYVRDRFYLTGLGPENFATALEPPHAWVASFVRPCGIISLVFGVLFFRFLLKTS